MSRTIPVEDFVPEKPPSMEDEYIRTKVEEERKRFEELLEEEKNKIENQYRQRVLEMRKNMKLLVVDIIRAILKQELTNESVLLNQVDGFLSGESLIVHIPKSMPALKQRIEEAGATVIEEDRVGVRISGEEIIDTDPRWILPLISDLIQV